MPSAVRPQPARRFRRVLIVALIGIPLLAAAWFLAAFPGCGFVSGKYSPSDALGTPSNLPGPVAPELQTEPHTCGLHALRALYLAYGLDPDAHDLRFRLGVDAQAVPFDPASTGTLHPDIFRVLDQDGFAMDALDPDASDSTDRLTTHLDNGQYALALVYRDTYHWLVIAGREAESILIADSIDAQTYLRPTQEFMEEQALGIVLLQAANGTERIGLNRAHNLGLSEMVKAFDRFQDRRVETRD